MALFLDLPLELGQEVYRLACLPEHAAMIYCLSEADIFQLPCAIDSSKSIKYTNDWRVTKRKYPTAPHYARNLDVAFCKYSVANMRVRRGWVSSLWVIISAGTNEYSSPR